MVCLRLEYGMVQPSVQSVKREKSFSFSTIHSSRANVLAQDNKSE